jgi:Flp pilus assembly protein TadD
MDKTSAARTLTLPEALQAARQHQVAGRLPEAERLYRLVLDAQPKHVDALHLLGLLTHQRGDPATAVKLIRQAVALVPTFAEGHNNLGVVLQSQGNLSEAVACYQRAVELKPEYHDAHQNLAAALHSQGRAEEAAAAYRRAIDLKPDEPQTRNNLGAVLAGLERTDEAIACYRQAIALKPDYFEAHNNLGLSLQSQGRLHEAEHCYRTALRLKPDYSDARANLSVLLLLMGQFEEGWREFTLRDTVKGWENRPRDFAQPLWNGEDIGNRVLLISVEYGLGDTIQFCRYVPLLASRARVVLEVQRPLLRLLAGINGVEQVIAYGDPLPAFDVYCPLMSLPHILGTTLASIPADIPYLTADPARVAYWHERLSSLAGLRVGLTWAGNPRLARDRQRSIALNRFADLATVPGVDLVSLQKGEAASQTQSPPSSMVVHDWTGALNDFADTAALIENLDLVISVDTSIVHLAGALGKPVWLLNRFDTCWRWLADRDDSPWYPTLRQFRQPAWGDWDSVLTAVRAALEQAVRRRAGDPPESRHSVIR